MNIGGIEKLSLIDFPGELATVIFTKGCNFRCRFCYNPMLVWPEKQDKFKYAKDYQPITEDSLFAFLKSRLGKIDGVVITGGEPTLQVDLLDFLIKIKKLKLKIKLDTNGSNPQILEKIIKDSKKFEKNLIDYLAMDIKAPLKKYEQIIGVKINLNKILQSIKLIKNSFIPYEFRTTFVPALHDIEDVALMGKMIKGAERWYLQFFKSDTKLLDKSLENKKRFTSKEMGYIKTIAEKYVKIVDIRG